jgi:2-dehydropantoate 2-reductase
MPLNNLCIFGIGGVGGYFGGLIAHAIAQEEPRTRSVTFIARGEHLARIKRDGLLLNTSDTEGLVCRPTVATDTVADISPPDLYLVCVKSYDLDNAITAISHNITPHTLVIPLLNGVDIYERIRRILSTGIVLPACVYVGTHIERPGVVTQRGGDGKILCGKAPDLNNFDPQPLLDLFQQVRINFSWQDDPYPAIWEKFVFIAAFGLVTASSGKTLGEVMADADAAARTRRIMEEIVAIARQKGIALADDIVERALAKGHNFPPETKTSYQRDVETPGKPNEGDLFGGTILRLGQQYGVPTPTTREVFSAL